MEKASSSSVAAFILALSSGRNDSFSSNALKVVPEVMLLPSKLGGFVPSSELESALELSSEGVWLMTTLLGVNTELTNGTLIGTSDVLVSSFRSLSPSTILSWEALTSSAVFCADWDGCTSLCIETEAEPDIVVAGTGTAGATMIGTATLSRAVTGAFAFVAVAMVAESLDADAAATWMEQVRHDTVFGAQHWDQGEERPRTFAKDSLTSLPMDWNVAMAFAV